MNIFIQHMEIFEDPEHLQGLVQIFLQSTNERHALIITDVDRLLASPFSLIRTFFPREWRELIERISLDRDFRNRSEEPGSRPAGYHLEVVSNPCNSKTQRWRELHITALYAWSQRRLRLLLEDDDDFALLVGAARAYDRVPPGCESWLERARSEDWLSVDGRGGCGNVWATLRDYPKAERDLVRLFVVVDRDTDGPTEPLRSPQREILSCEREFSEARCWVLSKREVENYIPGRHLEAMTNLPPKPSKHSERRAFRSWARSTASQKDFVDMKAHFGEKQMARFLSQMTTQTTFGANDLDERAGDELRDLLGELRERL